MAVKRELNSTDWKGLKPWLEELSEKYEIGADEVKEIFEEEWEKIIGNKFNAKKPKALLVNNAKSFTDTTIKKRGEGMWSLIITGISDPMNFSENKIAAIKKDWVEKPDKREEMIELGKVATIEVMKGEKLPDGRTVPVGRKMAIRGDKPAKFDSENLKFVEGEIWMPENGDNIIPMEWQDKLGDGKTDNFRKGWPMTDSFNATAWGFCKPLMSKGDTSYSQFIISLRNQNANLKTHFLGYRAPLWTKLTARLYVNENKTLKNKDGSVSLYVFGANKKIDFSVDDDPEFDREVFVCGEDGVSRLAAAAISLNDVKDWHMAEMVDPNREGKLRYKHIGYNVAFLSRVDMDRVDEGGSISVGLTDPQLEGFKTCFLPRWMRKLPFEYDVSKNIKVVYSFQTRQSNFKYVDGKKIESDDGDINVNIMGIAALTEYDLREKKIEAIPDGEDEL